MIKKFFGKDLNFNQFRRIFFESNLFSYCDFRNKEIIIENVENFCFDEKESFIQEANKILKKEFRIFEKTYQFSNKINWHYSFFNDYIWKIKKSNQINKRPKIDNFSNVDIKYVWEFNRHQFLSYLGFSYYMTANKKYAIEFKKLILDWIKQNPPIIGVNWKSGLEVSLRLISWIFTLYFFEDSDEINNEQFFKQIFKSMFQHAFYLRYFYVKHSFNHTVGDLFGLYFFSKVFEKIKPIRNWEKKFFTKFKKQIFLQTRKDGVDIEQSVNYHRFVLEFFTLFSILNKNKLKSKEKKRIEKMFEYLLYIIKPDGSFPLIGDADDGKVLPFILNYKDITNYLFNFAAVIYKRDDLKFINKNVKIPLILIFGEKGLNIFEEFSVKSPERKLVYFPKSGYLSMRNKWSRYANYIFIDFGRFGPLNSPHSHSDITNFIFSYQGQKIIIDSGTGSYNKSWKERNYFRSSKSHNILVINDKNQADIVNWFAWNNKPKIKRTFTEKENSIIFSVIHNAYENFLVKRKFIVNKKLNKVLICDSIFSSANREKENLTVKIYFHFPKKIKLKIKGNKTIIIDQKLKMVIKSDKEFELSTQKSYFSSKYGYKSIKNTLIVQSDYNFNKDRKILVNTFLTPLIEN